MLHSGIFDQTMILIVKSTLAFYIVAVFGTLGTLGMLAGCGQPGALYLPKPPAAKVAPAPAASTTPPSPSSTAPTIK
jgi:predicted small lipoprotein YifL